MREYLFRGKRKDNGEWVYGDLIHRKVWYTDVYIIRCSDDGFDHYEEYEVVPETVGLYTGTTDARSGKKIFEDDIVVSTNANRLSNRPHLVDYCPSGAYCYCDPKREPVVIGNIHDNPNILKGA